MKYNASSLYFVGTFDSDILNSYFKKKSPIQATTEGRITFLYEEEEHINTTEKTKPVYSNSVQLGLNPTVYTVNVVYLLQQLISHIFVISKQS